jgi:CMP-N,N'-diacetyllegionaminic acid synthase
MSKKFCFDVDGVIMTITPQNNYNLSHPILETVEIINQLYDQGNYIIIFTARGYVTGIDWTELTVDQLNKCGLKYHELKFGKPAADYYIDDKFISLEGLKEKLTTNKL